MTRSSPRSTRRRDLLDRQVATGVSVVLLVVLALWFWGTAGSTSAARLAVLRTIEPYAFAVHEQLVFNKSHLGQWFQTVHAGYDDAWTWSGHRAPSLWLVSLLYPLKPSALWLSELMIGAIVLGCIPAALIGRDALKSPWGLLLGGGLYLGSPAIMATALQDYQDLCFAVPCLTFTLWTLRQPRLWLVALGVVVGVLPREECVPIVVGAAALTWPVHPLRGARRKRWAAQLGLVLLLAGVYALAMQVLAPITFQAGDAGARHDTPVVNALREVFETRGAADLAGLHHPDFYALLWMPLLGLAVLSPLTALPAVGLVLMHLTVPYGNGVDRAWAGHAHHLAPALPFLVVAATEGLARLLRFVAAPRLPGGRTLPVGAAGPVLAVLLAVGLAGYGGWWTVQWGRSFNLVTAFWPTPPAYQHPVWTLVQRLPEGAIPAVSTAHAVAVSDRTESYTYEESVFDKRPLLKLGAATHLIVQESLTDVVAWGMAMDGAEVVDREDGYLTIAWTPGARDRSDRQRADRWPTPAQWAPSGGASHRPPGVGPPVGPQ